MFIPILIILLLSALEVLFRSRMTITFALGNLFAISVLVLNFLHSDDILICAIQIVLSTAFVLAASYITLKFKKCNFNKKIYSYSMFLSLFRNKDMKLIGKIMPYNIYQLKYNLRNLYFTDIASKGSSLISGASGSGKTYFIKSLIKQDIYHGKNAIYFDYKGDEEVANDISEYAIKNGYTVYKLSGEESNFTYDPLKNLNLSGQIEAIINMRKWSMDGADAHYRTGTQLLLQKVLSDFMHNWQEAQDNNMLNKSGAHETDYSKNYTYALYDYIKHYSPTKAEIDAYNTVSKLLELLVSSSIGDIFKSKRDLVLNLNDRKEKFLLIASFTSSNKELAGSFSSLFFKDLLDSATISPYLSTMSLYIDEFATLENSFIIKDILEKGRSGGIATYLALQDINQIVINTNDAYLNSILGTINTFIIFSGVTRVTAEKFAGVQLFDIEQVLMSLKKPINGKAPTAIFISKYPTLNKDSNSEVFRFIPYIFDSHTAKDNKSNKKELDEIPASDTSAENNSSNIKIKIDSNDTMLNIKRKNTDTVDDIEDIRTVDYSDFI